MLDLKKANQLMEDIIKENHNFSPITNKDYSLFQSYFDKEPHSYGNSWTYITQGMYGVGPNNLGYKYYDGENLSAVCIYPKVENPDINVFYWIRPMGKNMVSKISIYSKKLKKQKKIPIYVKKIDRKNYHDLLDLGFKNTTNFPWHQSAPSEDDSYSEILLDVDKILENPDKSKQVKNSIKHYHRIKPKVNVQQISTKKEQNAAWAVTQKFFKQNLNSLLNNISSPNDYYNLIYSTISANYKMFLIKLSGRPVGIFDLNHNKKNYYSSYCSLTLREEVPNLNDFITIYSCYQVQSNHAQYLNLGGSETLGLDSFKKKFHYYLTNQMYWACLV